MADWFRRSGEVLTLMLHIQPGAKRSELAGLHGEVLLKFIAGLSACRCARSS